MVQQCKYNSGLYIVIFNDACFTGFYFLPSPISLPSPFFVKNFFNNFQITVYLPVNGYIPQHILGAIYNTILSLLQYTVFLHITNCICIMIFYFICYKSMVLAVMSLRVQYPEKNVTSELNQLQILLYSLLNRNFNEIWTRNLISLLIKKV